ncbi:MATE family efflux transporter [Photobacterium sp. ZSDE20]|uniref:MATE family efflux transporter n=1 Tax=Photobacterium pectinilyticum TaxID=2906793 RepID=A0ABT1MZ89_9GAMM|nr:MATE family efflux transporter [Photobacterium sp. ZSDE20]MCQ1056954.1 MATE family efflux transporter [Photobacterium sp. ZSDE20]MDD1821089.1 MATE family efflux transporter [Photobacterium sp. ZSDE20]
MKKLISLAIPLIISQLVAQLLVFTDVWMMAQMSILAIAGGGLGAAVYSIIFTVAGSTVGCVANLIAIAYGKRLKDTDKGDAEVSISLKSGLLLSVILTLTLLPLFFLMDGLLLKANQDPEAIVLAVDYLDALKWAMLPTLILLVLRSLVSAFGDTRSVMVMSIVTVILNVPLSYLIAFHWQMGLAGLGYGTALAAFIVMLGYGYWVFTRNKYRQYNPLTHWHEYRLGILVPLLAIGVPIMIATLMEHALFSTAVLLAGTLGAVSLAIHQIAMQCLNLSWNVAFGLSQAASILVSQHVGQQEPEIVKYYAKQGLILVTITSTLLGILLIANPEFLTVVFNVEGDTLAGELVAALPGVMIMVAACFVVDAWQLAAISILRGMKVVKTPTVTTVIGYWLIGLPAAWLLMHKFGLEGVWGGIAVGLAATGLMLLFILLRELRKLEGQYEGNYIEQESTVMSS